ncbi:hypothetical protein EDD16DRAFT_1729426 [Pisolithus croceorrhizus]|nr:hypothetical protein EDD16DRAFT_1729426 [Pisolithus croceorrhizus]
MCHALYFYLVTNDGVPTSLQHIVWSFPATLLVNLLVVIAVQCVFAHKIYHLCLVCLPRVKWLVTTPIILLMVAHFRFGIETIILLYSNFSYPPHRHASLCVGWSIKSGTRSTFSSTKRLVTTLVIYAVNRCLLVSVVSLAEFVTIVELQAAWSMGMDFMKGKSSLNTRQHLRPQGSMTTTELSEDIYTVHLTNTPKFSEGIKSSKDGERHVDVHEGAVIDITADLALDKTTALRGEGETTTTVLQWKFGHRNVTPRRTVPSNSLLGMICDLTWVKPGTYPPTVPSPGKNLFLKNATECCLRNWPVLSESGTSVASGGVIPYESSLPPCWSQCNKVNIQGKGGNPGSTDEPSLPTLAGKLRTRKGQILMSRHGMSP